ncbi:hypothetical protein H5410_061491, partial [Solanum commersonii]
YIDGVESFLDFAYSYGDPQGEEIQFSCAKYCNIHWTRRNVVLYKMDQSRGMDYSRDDIDGLLNDQFRDVVQTEGVYDGPNEEAKKFYNLVEKVSQELYPGCTGFSKLALTLQTLSLFPNKGVPLGAKKTDPFILDNNGVTLVSSTTSFASSNDKNMIVADLTYYGRIVDIVELDCYGHFMVVLFKSDWYEVENDTYGLTYVYFNKRIFCDLFNMGDQVESNLPQNSDEVLLTRTDVPEIIIGVPSEEFVTQQLEV